MAYLFFPSLVWDMARAYREPAATTERVCGATEESQREDAESIFVNVVERGKKSRPI